LGSLCPVPSGERKTEQPPPGSCRGGVSGAHASARDGEAAALAHLGLPRRVDEDGWWSHRMLRPAEVRRICVRGGKRSSSTVLYTQRAPPCVSIPGTRASVPFGSPSASYLDGHALASLLVRPWGGTRRTKSRAMGVRGADRTWTSCPVTLRLCLVGPCSRGSGAPPRAKSCHAPRSAPRNRVEGVCCDHPLPIRPSARARTPP